MTTTSTNRVAQWLAALGVLCAGNMPAEEAQMKIGAYVPLLTDAFPTGAFCQTSLAEVGRLCRFFPSYGELSAHLSAWWRENRPAAGPALASSADHRPSQMSKMDHAWVAYWHKHSPDARQAEADLGSKLFDIDPPQRPLARLVSLIRTHSPAAWESISQSVGTLKREGPSEVERAAVRRAVETITADAHGVGDHSATYSPQRKSATLSDEQLQSVRSAAGIVHNAASHDGKSDAEIIPPVRQQRNMPARAWWKDAA